MITVKIELWPGGREDRATEIGRMYIANDGTGESDRGDYKVGVCRRGTTDVPREVIPERYQTDDYPKAARAGEVKDYPRLAYNVWRLIARSILAAFPEEDKAPAKRHPVLDAMVMRGLHAMRRYFMVSFGPTSDISAAVAWLDASARDDE